MKFDHDGPMVARVFDRSGKDCGYMSATKACGMVGRKRAMLTSVKPFTIMLFRAINESSGDQEEENDHIQQHR